MGILEDIVRVYNKPDPHPYLFAIGQTVRVLKNVVDDGQTHPEWAGAVGTITSRRTTGLHKEHWYTLRHPKLRGSSEFREDELDWRYARKAERSAAK